MAKILVLDIDETLVHTIWCESPSHVKKYTNMCNKYPSRIFRPFHDGNYFVIKRPGLDMFLQNVYKIFDYVAVWSAGTYDYVHTLCDYIFKHFPDPAFILTRNDCSINKNHKYYKDLDWIRVNVEWLPENIYLLLLDDLNDNINANKYNSYKIKKFEGKTIKKKDSELSKFTKTILGD